MKDLTMSDNKPATPKPPVPARTSQAWRYQRCPMCDSRPANELQAMQKFCHSCNAYYNKG